MTRSFAPDALYGLMAGAGTLDATNAIQGHQSHTGTITGYLPGPAGSQQ